MSSQLVPYEHQLKTNNDELRIVLVGKTGVGKSAVGNTILKCKAFTSRLSSSSVTEDCKKYYGKVDEQCVTVIDTPGLFDTKRSENEIVDEMKMCICLSAPGPHVFLVVVQIGRFTSEKQETVKIIQTTFGEKAANYSMVLFTNGDKLEEESIEDYIGENNYLKSVLDQCKGGFHVFNNKDEDPSQVTELLEKINKMVEMNGGSHYTNEMFQEAERAIEEEKERILKEKEEDRKMEEEELRNKFEADYLERKQKELKEKCEREA